MRLDCKIVLSIPFLFFSIYKRTSTNYKGQKNWSTNWITRLQGWFLDIACKEIEASFDGNSIQGWAGFVICSTFRKIKEILKEWNVAAEETIKTRKKSTQRIRLFWLKAEANNLSSLEDDIRAAIKGELMEIYHFTNSDFI